MSETFVTLHGWVGADVVLRKANGHSVLDLRVASTARLKRNGEWFDGDTTWYTVTVWREQADNVLRSVHKGDPVIVHGRLRTDVYTRQDGESASKLVIDGALVGHDLRWGTSQFARKPRADRGEADGSQDGHPEGDAQTEGPPGWAVDERSGGAGSEQSGSDAA
jgi:single-strand DNA-binding protein